jgi:hypothetical protein
MYFIQRRLRWVGEQGPAILYRLFGNLNLLLSGMGLKPGNLPQEYSHFLTLPGLIQDGVGLVSVAPDYGGMLRCGAG